MELGTELEPSSEALEKKTTSNWGYLNPERVEERFTDFKPLLNETEAVTEANRCINCYAAPCINACPTEINIPQFINRIGTGNVIGAAKTILDSNILGHSCAVSCPTEVLCEGACVYNRLNKQPIMIGKLQRYAVQHAYEKGHQFYTPGKPTGKKVALLGAGPASLACAHELRKLGHETLIFEKTKIPGGLNTQGIAPYKMKASVSLWEIQQVVQMGVQFHFEQELGRNLEMEQLLQNHDAVFLGIGLGPDSQLDIPGSEHPRIQGAVNFIAHLKLDASAELGWLDRVTSALVIGGGNTALDACRELQALGIPKVRVSYRRGENDMSGYAHEFKIARQSGVEFLFHTLPVEFQTLSMDLLRTVLRKTEIDARGKVRVLDETFHLDAGLVLVATGQSKLEPLLSKVPGLKFEGGRLKTSETHQTGHPKIFAGGDLVNGGMEVVNAVAEGKRAALAIHKGLIHG